MEFACVLLLLSATFMAAAATRHGRPVSAAFIFGDSLFDAGTNNYIPNSTIRSNVRPYGETFFPQPTGRWNDGRVIPDLLADTLGLKFPSPYLQPGANFDQGANFASAGSGFLSTTNEGNVVSLDEQVQQFKKLVETENYSSEFMADSVVALSAGANDLNSALRNNTEVPAMLSTYRKALTSMYGLGVRRFIVLALGPLGCTPGARLIRGRGGHDLRLGLEGCLDILNTAVRLWNVELETTSRSLLESLPDAQIVVVNPYEVVLTANQYPSRYGFTNARDGCCGGGPFRAAAFCSNADHHDSQVVEQQSRYRQSLCRTPENYFYWDANHPTQAAATWMFKNFWYGDISKPHNLNAFFQDYHVPNPPPLRTREEDPL